LSGNEGVTVNRFLPAAGANLQDWKVSELENGNYVLEFFSPARNVGFGKRYVQEIDAAGILVREFKDTLGSEGLIERKWLHGEPGSEIERPPLEIP
jgi:hypothetical protein